MSPSSTPLEDLLARNSRWSPFLYILLLAISPQPFAHGQGNPESTPPAKSSFSRSINHLFNYLNMAGTKTAGDFRPLTFPERRNIYLKTMVNPIGFLKAGFSAGIDQWNDKPHEWGQGAAGYGKRLLNIEGQYTIQRTVTFGISSVLHEDNRYFNSGRTGVWSRTRYALESGVLARHDDGRRAFSWSQVGGVAAGAFLSRLWQPASESSAANGAISFGLTMASNAGFGILKEYLPDIGRAIAGKHEKSKAGSKPTCEPVVGR
ncbi:MAG TPA: hypothetical protein VN708_00275 [Terriglobales bacterium]|nr:hypothetical protein [Terriglobales bacterium]